jgi:bla regulator protein blaR1
VAALLADHLWQSTVFALAMALLAALLRNSAARVRYALWLAASLKFLVPFAALVAAGASLPWRAAVEPPSPMLMMTQTVVSPFADDRSLVRAAAAVSAYGIDWSLLGAAALWLGGLAVVLMRWAAAWLRTRRLVRAATLVEAGRVVRVLHELRDWPRTPVPLRATHAAIEPGVFGIWRPVLLWPRHIEDRLSDAQIAAILTHELAHVRRRDNLTAAMHMAVRALFWFHPMVLWIEARLMDERERACDEVVVFSSGDREAYAEGLLKACRFSVESSVPCAAGVTGGDLQRRVTAIMCTAHRPTVSRLAAAVVSLVVVASIAGPFAIGLIAAPPRMRPPQIAVGDGDDPSFEVASVKLAADQSGPRTIVFQPGGRFVTENISTRTVIAAAYGGRVPLQEFRIKGGPSWLATERYTITAKAATDQPATTNGPPPAMFAMVRSLLRDRFGLQVHLETQDADIYRLVRARRDGALGPGITPSDAGCSTIKAAVPSRPLPPGTVPRCGGRIGPGKLTFNGLPMGDLAARDLTRAVGAVVVDHTGIAGDFDVTLEWTPDTPDAGPQARTGDPGVSIFTAVQEQLGLKLEPARGPVDVLVIDRIERPTPD